MATLGENYTDSTHSSGGNYDIVLVPPQLPPFLSVEFNLKPIVGTPSAEEVKLVHAVIRASSTFLHTPEFRDSNLPAELSQHLFDTQMMCHREKYPVGIFPNDIVYTPPKLPPHIPVKLEPVVGPPSDDELCSAHAALRTSDYFASIASVFDAELSVQLSQHLFDLQLARHVQRSARDETMTATGPEYVRPPSTARQGEPTWVHAHEQNAETQESTRILLDIRESLKNVIKVLIASQNSLARSVNSGYRYNTDCPYAPGAHSLINDKGEEPETHNLPTLQGFHAFNTNNGTQRPSQLDKKVLARYLQFYGIGSEMIEEGEDLNIKPGMEEDAWKLLDQRVYFHST